MSYAGTELDTPLPAIRQNWRGGFSADDEPGRVLRGHPDALATCDKVCSLLDRFGQYSVRVSKSQVAFRRRRGFAYLWMPGHYLTKPTAEVVLSIALGRHGHSRRFKELAHPAPAHWIHHLEIHDLRDLDDEVVGWLREDRRPRGVNTRTRGRRHVRFA